MHLRRSLWLVLFASTGFAQALDPDTQSLVDHLNADRDTFGAGNARMLQLGRSLEDQARNTKNLSVSRIEEESIPEFSDPKLAGTTRAADGFLKFTLANSDIVIVGRLENQLSIFNTNKTSIVTDSLLKVSNVLYDKQGIGLHAGDKIVVTRPGGRLRIDDHAIEVRVEGFPAFDAGADYLLFLHRVPVSGSYDVQRLDAFVIEGVSIRPLATKAKVHPAAPYLTSTEAFLEKVRTFAEASSHAVESSRYDDSFLRSLSVSPTGSRLA